MIQTPAHRYRYRYHRVLSLGLLSVIVWSTSQLQVVSGIDQLAYEESIVTAPPMKPVVDFTLRDDFYVGKCEPCIARSEYRIQVIAHGTQNDVYWQQVQTAMQQASRDTMVAVSITLYSPTLDQSEIYLRMANSIRQAATASNSDRPDALLVTLPSVVVHQAITVALAAGMPVFGFHTGYDVAPALGVLGFVAQHETLAGRVVADEVIQLLRRRDVAEAKENREVDNTGDDDDKTTIVFNMNDNSTTAFVPTLPPTSDELIQQRRVMFVNSEPDNKLMLERYQGVQEILTQHPAIVQVDTIDVRPVDVFQSVQTVQEEVFKDCAYDVVVLSEAALVNLVDIVTSAMVDLGCQGTTTVVTFGMSEQIVEAIVQGHIAFTAAPQHYIESVFAVVMTSMFITTGKKLSLPKDRKMYLSGPVIVTPDNVPTDTVQTCREQAFPVCNLEGEAFDPMTTTSTTGKLGKCNFRGCLPRDTIRIGGVLHGITTDLFWDPVFAAATQAAVDVGVVLELERLEPQETFQILHAKMAARIRNLCESGVDGLFVTIPDDTVAESILYCRSLHVPVISINAGADQVEELDILQHIGQEEYNAGYGAGKRLVQEGMKEGYCLNHAPGNIVLDDRCRGFSDAIEEHPDVVYHGMVVVADDNQAKFTQAVETAVMERSGNIADTWDGIGLLLGGASQMGEALHLHSLHINSVIGSFDISDSMFQAFDEGWLKFGIDQQPFLQGSLPVFLLAYAAYTQQSLANTVIETGPRFVVEPPSVYEERCESSFFSICSILPEEDFQLISSWLLAIGYTFVAITTFTALICLAWVVYYRERSLLVRISQPPFLITLACGCIVSILSIIPMGVQTEYRFVKDDIATGTLTAEENADIQTVDASCMLVPWLNSIGFVMVFSSLFSRIWRVQMIFKAGEALRRRTVSLIDIAPYVAIMFVVVLSLLIAWQAVDPFQWGREVLLVDNDGYVLESTGRCTSDTGWYFWIAILGFQILCVFYALVLCFQTKHIQDDLSESSNTFLAVICIFQVNVIALPISAMVQDDTEVFYFVRSCALFLQNYTVLCLMFWPKMYRTFTGSDGLPPMSSLRGSANGGPTMRSGNRVSFHIPTNDQMDNSNISTPFGYGANDVSSSMTRARMKFKDSSDQFDFGKERRPTSPINGMRKLAPAEAAAMANHSESGMMMAAPGAMMAATAEAAARANAASAAARSGSVSSGAGVMSHEPGAAIPASEPGVAMPAAESTAPFASPEPGSKTGAPEAGRATMPSAEPGSMRRTREAGSMMAATVESAARANNEASVRGSVGEPGASMSGEPGAGMSFSEPGSVPFLPGRSRLLTASAKAAAMANHAAALRASSGELGASVAAEPGAALTPEPGSLMATPGRDRMLAASARAASTRDQPEPGVVMSAEPGSIMVSPERARMLAASARAASASMINHTEPGAVTSRQVPGEPGSTMATLERARMLAASARAASASVTSHPEPGAVALGDVPPEPGSNMAVPVRDRMLEPTAEAKGMSSHTVPDPEPGNASTGPCAGEEIEEGRLMVSTAAAESAAIPDEAELKKSAKAEEPGRPVQTEDATSDPEAGMARLPSPPLRTDTALDTKIPAKRRSLPMHTELSDLDEGRQVNPGIQEQTHGGMSDSDSSMPQHPGMQHGRLAGMHRTEGGQMAPGRQEREGMPVHPAMQHHREAALSDLEARRPVDPAIQRHFGEGGSDSEGGPLLHPGMRNHVDAGMSDSEERTPAHPAMQRHMVEGFPRPASGVPSHPGIQSQRMRMQSPAEDGMSDSDDGMPSHPAMRPNVEARLSSPELRLSAHPRLQRRMKAGVTQGMPGNPAMRHHIDARMPDSEDRMPVHPGMQRHSEEGLSDSEEGMQEHPAMRSSMDRALPDPETLRRAQQRMQSNMGRGIPGSGGRMAIHPAMRQRIDARMAGEEVRGHPGMHRSSSESRMPVHPAMRRHIDASMSGSEEGVSAHPGMQRHFDDEGGMSVHPAMRGHIGARMPGSEERVRVHPGMHRSSSESRMPVHPAIRPHTNAIIASPVARVRVHPGMQRSHSDEGLSDSEEGIQGHPAMRLTSSNETHNWLYPGLSRETSGPAEDTVVEQVEAAVAVEKVEKRSEPETDSSTTVEEGSEPTEALVNGDGNSCPLDNQNSSTTRDDTDAVSSAAESHEEVTDSEAQGDTKDNSQR
ncbi:acid type B receptor subunit [Seminavis robusta]|uniref:Acid type B receptor subunit n=1 Tax=Seminavis robusta TaxID=568900 RepID=A0A9N8DDX7_9STRA|nr:acid type B receptor subunit [Seminavis robusta]|eukprot:Sro28_g018560.1 acid type B receptor subunit (2180) ;mRNA; r:21911-29299